MAASLTSSSQLFIAAGAVDSSDDVATTVFVLLLVLTPFVLLTAIFWTKRFTRSERQPPLSRPSRVAGGNQAAKSAAQRANASRSAPASPHRVIRLHSTTPGQSPFEYNVGDIQGTRGSALVRAA